jgi:protein-S-isoprenylcysteine O-methyltransferase Ste14
MLAPALVSRVISALWLALIAYWLVLGFGNKKNRVKQSRSSRVVYLVVAVGVVYGITHVRQLRIPLLATTAAGQIAGMLLCGAGIAIAMWARHILGTNWSGIVTVKQGHTLIRIGPYRYVRHPIYSGIILGAAGTFLAVLPTVQGVISLVFILVGLRVKSRLEERLLTGEFPEEYPRYCREVKALVPFVY